MKNWGKFEDNLRKIKEFEEYEKKIGKPADNLNTIWGHIKEKLRKIWRDRENLKKIWGNKK